MIKFIKSNWVSLATIAVLAAIFAIILFVGPNKFERREMALRDSLELVKQGWTAATQELLSERELNKRLAQANQGASVALKEKVTTIASLNGTIASLKGSTQAKEFGFETNRLRVKYLQPQDKFDWEIKPRSYSIWVMKTSSWYAKGQDDLGAPIEITKCEVAEQKPPVMSNWNAALSLTGNTSTELYLGGVVKYKRWAAGPGIGLTKDGIAYQLQLERWIK